MIRIAARIANGSVVLAALVFTYAAAQADVSPRESLRMVCWGCVVAALGVPGVVAFRPSAISGRGWSAATYCSSGLLILVGLAAWATSHPHHPAAPYPPIETAVSTRGAKM